MRAIHALLDAVTGPTYPSVVNEELQLLEGQVKRVVFSNDETGFTVFAFKPDSGDEVTVVGVTGDLEEGDELRINGVVEEHPRFGPRFKAQTTQRLTPRTLEGIEKYLAGPRVEGIGAEIARRLVASCGEQTLDVLDSDPDRLTEV